MLTTKMSLKRQSWLVAAVCMVADGASVVLDGCVTWQNWLVLVLTLAVDAALAGPARLSGLVAVAHAALQAGMVVFGMWSSANDAGMLIAGYRAGAWLHGVPAVASLIVLAAGLMIAHVGMSGDVLRGLVGMVKYAVLPWLVGRYTTARRAYLAELEKRTELERRDAQEAVDKAISAERSSIARDLHDVIVHHVSAIGLHAGAARLGLPAGNAPLEGSLRSVETASRAAMVDLRHLLDLLHGDNSEGARQPGLDNLDELFEGVQAAGIPARLEVSGPWREVPESLGITVYRIVQEMLTNALRHGDPSGVTVTLEYGPSSLSIAAGNKVGIRPDQPASVRRGLVGIRNRAAMFSGRTRYGLEPDRQTWRTVVTFPLEDQ
jgi:signal transduction histidine kinase